MGQSAAFAGLTAVLIASLLALARLSQEAVEATEPRHDEGGRAMRAEGGRATHGRAGFGDDLSSASGGDTALTDPVLPRFEPPESFTGESGEASLHPRQGRPGRAERLAELSTWTLLANVAFTQGLFGLVLAAGAFYFEISPSALGIGDAPLSTGLPGVLVGVAFGVGLWLANEAAGAFADAAGAGFDESLREILAPDDASGWALLLGVVLPIVAAVEEFVFRAAAIGAVAAGFGVSPWALAILSSVAFGVAHGAQGRAGMLVTGALGFALAGGFVVTGSLLVVVVAHYVVNATEMVVHEGLGIERPLGRVGGDGA